MDAYLLENQDRDNPHSMLHAPCNTMQQQKCAVFEITERQCSSCSITVYQSRWTPCMHSTMTDCRAARRYLADSCGRLCVKPKHGEPHIVRCYATPTNSHVFIYSVFCREQHEVSIFRRTERVSNSKTGHITLTKHRYRPVNFLFACSCHRPLPYQI